MNHIKWWVVLSFLILGGGCNTLSERQENDLDVLIPSEWRNLSDSNQPVRHNWIDSFDDPVLSELVETAVANNFDLKLVAARVEAAIAQARIDGRVENRFSIP